MITYTDIERQVRESLGMYEEDFSVEGITREIIDRHGLVDAGNLEGFWDIAARHELGIVTEETWTAAELGLEHLNPFISVDMTPEGGSVEWHEYLHFHEEREGNEDLFDDDGWLTDEAERALAERYDAGVEHFGGDDPHVTLIWSIPPMSAERIGEYMWNDLARVANETDPGTFGSSYVFNEIRRALG